ncbi:hypothetical protein [Streptomyces sp. NPDC058953]|uniref:hypothetical protein n=1 Tax=Streptomyces sp. NPDC058953 TaxID=3346676 RepID=UPI0036C4716F
MRNRGVGYGLAAALGSLVLSALTVPAANGNAIRGHDEPPDPEIRGTAVGGARGGGAGRGRF